MLDYAAVDGNESWCRPRLMVHMAWERLVKIEVSISLEAVIMSL